MLVESAQTWEYSDYLNDDGIVDSRLHRWVQCNDYNRHVRLVLSTQMARRIISWDL